MPDEKKVAADDTANAVPVAPPPSEEPEGFPTEPPKDANTESEADE